MSQIFTSSISGSVPPSVATSYVTDSGVAVPVANILNVLGSDTVVNNDNGLRTIGSVNTVTVQLTNRSTGQITTTDATPTTGISLALGATPGTYIIDGLIAAYDVTDTASGGYGFTSVVRTTGAAAIEIGTDNTLEYEDAAMATADINVGVTLNTFVVDVTGIVGKTIDWNTSLTFRFVG